MKSNIHERALQNAQQFNSASRDLFAILVEVDQTRAFEDHQYTHLIPYCINFLKIDPDIAKTLVRIVRKSIHVPRTRAGRQPRRASHFQSKSHLLGDNA